MYIGLSGANFVVIDWSFLILINMMKVGITLLWIWMFSFETIFAGVRIVILGSSTAEGAGASVRENSWVSRFSRYVKDVDVTNEVVNLAKGGYTTCAIMPNGTPDYLTNGHLLTVDTLRNIDKALSLFPDIIIINMPTNDTSNGIPIQVQLSHFETIVDKARTHGVKVWITTSQPHNFGEHYQPPYSDNYLPDVAKQKFRNQFGVLSKEIIKRYGDYAIDFYTGIATDDGYGFIKPEYDSGDGVHLGDKAHAELFERVKKKVLLK